MGAVRRTPRLAALLVLALAACGAGAETTYVATLRDRGPDTGAQGGGLYIVDLETRASRLVAPLRIGGAVPIGLTGLSVHPRTGVFYGITGGFSPNLPRSLVTIDPETGNATLVGNLGHDGADIRFDRKGTLYVWLNDTNQLGTIDVGTGLATPLEFQPYPQTLGGGIAVDNEGRVYIAANTSAGSLDVYDPASKRVTTGPNITGAPYVSSINSMAFSRDGGLYAVNSNLGTPAKAKLIRIDARTGKAEEVAPLPDDVDPVAFSVGLRERPALETPANSRQWTFAGLMLAAGIFLGLAVGRLFPQRRRR